MWIYCFPQEASASFLGEAGENADLHTCLLYRVAMGRGTILGEKKKQKKTRELRDCIDSLNQGISCSSENPRSQLPYSAVKPKCLSFHNYHGHKAIEASVQMQA